MENPLVSDAYTTHTFGPFASPPPGPDLASEFEPSREWKDALFKRVQETYEDMVAEAKRHLEDCLAADGLTNDQLHDQRYKRHIAEYQERKENARKLSQQAYNDELQRERYERRWGAGYAMPRSWTEDVGAEQQAIMDNIARKRTASESGSIKDPPVQVTEAVKEPEKSDIDEAEEDEEEIEDDEEDMQGPTAVSNSPSTSRPISIPTTYKRSSYGPTRSPEVWMPPPIALEEDKRERERKRELESVSRRGSITSRRGSINSVRSKPSTNNVREKAVTDDPGLRPKTSINFRPPSVPVPIPELHDDDEQSYSPSKGKGKAPEVPEAFNWERTAKESWRNDPEVLPRSAAVFTTPVTPRRSRSPDDSESESSSGSEEAKRKSAERAWLHHGRSRGREKQPMSTRSQFSTQSISRRASFLSSPSPPASATMSQAQGPPPPPPFSTKPNPSLLSQSRPTPSPSVVQSPTAVSSSPVTTYAPHPPNLAHVSQGMHSHPVYIPSNPNPRLPERTQSLHKPSNHEPSSLSRHHTLPPELPRFPNVERLFVNQEPDSATDDESESEPEPPVVRRRRSHRTPDESPSTYAPKTSHKSSRPQSIGIPRSQTLQSVGASLLPSNYLPTSAAASQTPSRRSSSHYFQTPTLPSTPYQPPTSTSYNSSAAFPSPSPFMPPQPADPNAWKHWSQQEQEPLSETDDEESEAEAQLEEQRRLAEDRRRRDEDARRREYDDVLRRKEEEQRIRDEKRKEEERLLREEQRLEAERRADLARQEEALRLQREELLRKEEEARLQRLILEQAEESRRKEEEIARKEAEARAKEAEVQRKEEEARRLELEIKRKEKEARAEARRRDAELKAREAELKAREEEFQRKQREAELLRREEELRKKEEEARQREAEARQREEEQRQWEEEQRRREEEQRRREEEAKRAEEDRLRKEREEQRLKEREEKRRLAREEKERRQREEKERKEKAEAERKLREEYEQRMQEEVDRRMREEEERRQREEQERLQREEQARQEAERAEAERRQQEKEMRKRQEEERRQAELAAERERQAELARQATERQRQDSLHRKAEEERLQRDRIQETWNSKEEARRARERQEREDAAFAKKLTDAELAKAEREREGRRRAEEIMQKKASGQWTDNTSTWSSASSSGWSSTSSNASSARSSASSASAWSSKSSTSSASNRTPSATTPNASSYKPRTTPTPTASSQPFPQQVPTPQPTPLSEAEWQRRQEENARKQQEKFRADQERMHREHEAREAGRILTKDEMIKLFETHEALWLKLNRGEVDKLTFRTFPWPMLRRPPEPENITAGAIEAYVLNPHHPAAAKAERDRVKEQIRRWHPDRFDNRVLLKVSEEEKETVRRGAAEVVRGLNDLLTKVNAPGYGMFG